MTSDASLLSSVPYHQSYGIGVTFIDLVQWFLTWRKFSPGGKFTEPQIAAKVNFYESF